MSQTPKAVGIDIGKNSFHLVGHTDLLCQLAGVKLPTSGPVFSLQALTNL